MRVTNFNIKKVAFCPQTVIMFRMISRIKKYKRPKQQIVTCLGTKSAACTVKKRVLFRQTSGY